MTKKAGDSSKESIGFSGLNSLLSNLDDQLDHKPQSDSEGDVLSRAENKCFAKEINTSKDANPENSNSQIGKQAIENSKHKSWNWGIAAVIFLGVILAVFLSIREHKIEAKISGKANSSKSDSSQVANYQKPLTAKEETDSKREGESETLNYVTADTLNVRSGPGSNYEVIDRLYKWDEVGVLNNDENWAQIKYRGKIGWVFSHYLQEGSGEVAYQHYCYQNAGSKPRSGEILFRKGPTGLGELQVSNQTQREALVRLRQTNGSARYMMYVGPWTTEQLSKIGEGIYEVQIMYGHDFSRACEMFMQDPVVEVFDRKMDMQETPHYEYIEYSKYSITLHKVVDGNAATKKVDLSAFKN